MNLKDRLGIFAYHRSLKSLLCAAILSGIAGCTTTAIPPIVPSPPAKPWEADELIQSLEQRRDEFHSMRALARVDYSGPDGKNGFQEAILVQRPDRLRLETLSFLGAILIVTVNDKEIIGYQPREGVYVRGQCTEANLLRYTKIPLELNEITALLLGVPPVDIAAPWRQEGNSLIFTPPGQIKNRVSFETAQPVPTKWERFNSAGAIELSVTFADYVSTSAGLFPSTLLVDSPSKGTKLEIHYREPELNASIPSDFFSQQKPPDAKELPIESLGS